MDKDSDKSEEQPTAEKPKVRPRPAYVQRVVKVKRCGGCTR